MVRPATVLAELLLALLLAILPLATAVAAQPDGSVALVRIPLAGGSEASGALFDAPLELLALEDYAEPYALALVDQPGRAWLRAHGYRFQVLDSRAGGASYWMVDLAAGPAVDRVAVELYNDGIRAVWRLEPGESAQLHKEAWLVDQPLRRSERQPLALPASVTPIAQVQQIISQVDLPRLMTYVAELSGQTQAVILGQPYTIATRNTYSGLPLQMAVAYISERLQRLGLAVTTHTWNAGYPPNVIAEKPGLDPDAGIVIICAHLDSTASGNPAILAPGADDNASGSAAVLLAAEVLAHYNFDATLRFILFTGEEQGLLGSKEYAQMVQGQDIRGVLNMDMIAWDNAGGPDMDIHSKSTVPGNTDLASLYAEVISAYQLPLTPVVYDSGTGASDHAAFWTYNIPAILAIENYRSDPGIAQDFNAYYHSTNDRVKHFNQSFFRAMTQASLATFALMGAMRTDCYWADLDCSGDVNVLDLTRAAAAWQAQSGQWNWSAVYDVNGDGAITVVDIQHFAAEWSWNGS